MFSQHDIEKVQTDCKQNIITGAQAYTLEDILTNIKSNIETNTHSLLEKLKNIQILAAVNAETHRFQNMKSADFATVVP